MDIDTFCTWTIFRVSFFPEISPANFPKFLFSTGSQENQLGKLQLPDRCTTVQTRDPLKETPRLHCRKSPCCYGRSQTLDDCHGCSASLFSHSTAPRPLFIYFFLDNPSSDDNWSHFFLERDTWQQLVAQHFSMCPIDSLSQKSIENENFINSIAELNVN